MKNWKKCFSLSLSILSLCLSPSLPLQECFRRGKHLLSPFSRTFWSPRPRRKRKKPNFFPFVLLWLARVDRQSRLARLSLADAWWTGGCVFSWSLLTCSRHNLEIDRSRDLTWRVGAESWWSDVERRSKETFNTLNTAAMSSWRLLCLLALAFFQSSVLAEQQRVATGKAAPGGPLQG